MNILNFQENLWRTKIPKSDLIGQRNSYQLKIDLMEFSSEFMLEELFKFSKDLLVGRDSNN
jgi:hypothetical protein